MRHIASNALFPSSLHSNQIHEAYAPPPPPPHHHQPPLVADHANYKPPQDTNCSSPPAYHPHPEATHNSQYNVYGGSPNYINNELHPPPNNPTTQNNKSVTDFLGASSPQSTSPTATVVLPPQSSWVQTDHFPHTTTPPVDYDQAAHPHQHRLLASETSGKPPAPLPLSQEKPQTFSLASLELLNNYGKGFKNASCSREENLINVNTIPTAITDESNSTAFGTHKLALGEIVKLAGERYIQFFTQKVDGFSSSIHPYGTSVVMSEVSAAETADVELVQILLTAAECVGHRQFDLASALITRCLWIASDAGNPAQRIVFYFSEALQRRVDLETGRTTLERLNQQSSYARGLELEDFNLAFLACHQALPFSQVSQFAAMQTIADNLKSATKIHLVDLHIRSGVQWTVLMQALAERDELPEIRISAVGTNNKSHVEGTGKRLLSFAQSLNLCLSFNAIIVSDMKELKEEMFGKEADEVVGVYAGIILRTMLAKADSLGNVMKVMRRLKPEVVVVAEVEANHNSPSFVSRFTESLFFYSALFDCLEDCMERNNEHRKIIEGTYLGEGIINMVGTEGDKRCTRSVRMDVWREYFGRFGMEEIELGDASIRQANLILRKFHGASRSCNITSNGKGLLIGWKGTPLHSLTTWKFV